MSKKRKKLDVTAITNTYGFIQDMIVCGDLDDDFENDDGLRLGDLMAKSDKAMAVLMEREREINKGL